MVEAVVVARHFSVVIVVTTYGPQSNLTSNGVRPFIRLIKD